MGAFIPSLNLRIASRAVLSNHEAHCTQLVGVTTVEDELHELLLEAKRYLVQSKKPRVAKYREALKILGILPSGKSSLTNGDKRTIRQMIYIAKSARRNEKVELNFSSMIVSRGLHLVDHWEQKNESLVSKTPGPVKRGEIIRVISILFGITPEAVKRFAFPATLGDVMPKPRRKDS